MNKNSFPLAYFFSLLLTWTLLFGSSAPAQVNYAKAASSLGVYYPDRGGMFYLQDSDGSGVVNTVQITNAPTTALPFAGAWSTSGFDSIGLYDRANATFYLKNSTASSGAAETVFTYGWNNNYLLPVAGDWTGKGYKSIGTYDPTSGTFYLRNENNGTYNFGYADITITVRTDTGAAPPANAIPIMGDWVGDGICRVGFCDPATTKFYLRMTNNPASPNCAAPVTYGFGGAGWYGVVGKWLSTNPTIGFGAYLINSNQFAQTNAMAGGYTNQYLYLGPNGQEMATPPTPIIGRWVPTHSLASGQNTSPTSPSWMKSQIMYEMRLETFTDSTSSGSLAATIAGATGQLPYLKSLGVTGLVICPIQPNGQGNPISHDNSYDNYQPGALEPRLGTDTDMANFVTQAHADGMKVFADIVQHGVPPGSPYDVTGTSPFPYDYFSRTAAGGPIPLIWGTDQFDWTSPGLINWYGTNIGVSWVNKYGIDGFRMDLEPGVGSYPLISQLKSKIFTATGKQIIVIPEGKLTNAARAYTYDTSQNDYLINSSTGLLIDNVNGAAAGNIVDVVKSCPENFYTCGLSNHDSTAYVGMGKPSRFAYGMLLSPFVPRWFMGEEYNATPDFVVSGPLYSSQLHLSQATTNAAFLNQVKQLIQIRKTYQNIIAPMTGAMNLANIVKATISSSPATDLPPYSMWSGGSSITVLASNATATGNQTVKIPISSMGVGSTPYFQATDLVGGTTAIYSNAQVTAGLTYHLTSGGVIPIYLQAPLMYDSFNYTVSNLSGHAPTVGASTWNVVGSAISTDSTKAIILVNGGVVGAGSALGNYAFTPAANTIYTLQATSLFNGPIGAGHDCWFGVGFSNVTGGGNYGTNPGPWMLIRPQGVSTDNPGTVGFKGSTVTGSGTLAASNYASPPSSIVYKVTWNTLTGQAQYYINGVLQSAWTTTTTLPTGTYYAMFQAFQTGNAVNLKNISLTTQPAGP